MARHALTRELTPKQVNGGVFKRVIASCFEDQGEIEDHALIISQTLFTEQLYCDVGDVQQCNC